MNAWQKIQISWELVKHAFWQLTLISIVVYACYFARQHRGSSVKSSKRVKGVLEIPVSHHMPSYDYYNFL